MITKHFTIFHSLEGRNNLKYSAWQYVTREMKEFHLEIMHLKIWIWSMSHVFTDCHKMFTAFLDFAAICHGM